MRNFHFWLRWVLSNALGELIGLGVVGAAGALVIRESGEPEGTLKVLGFTALIIVLGAFEGGVLGLFQGWVLRSRLPQLRQRAWILATLLGAVTAWTLGMIPSAIASLSPLSRGSPPSIEDSTVFLLAGLMGLVLGIVLALPQWRVLRRYVRRASWWIPANSLAWACGMPIVFWVAGNLPADISWISSGAIALLCLALTGAVVGAVHGLALLWLL